MRNALLIGDDRLSDEMVEAQLWQVGYGSVSHAGNEGEAWQALSRRRPSLIVMLAKSGEPLPVKMLHALSRAADAPVLVAAPKAGYKLPCLGPGARLEGPFELEQMDQAIGNAERPVVSRVDCH